MPARLYSATLWDSGGEQNAGGYESGTPIAGTLWVIRDIVVGNAYLTTNGNRLNGFRLQTTFGLDLLVRLDQANIGTTWDWSGRQVLENPEQLSMQLLDDNYSWRVMGYVLTLP